MTPLTLAAAKPVDVEISLDSPQAVSYVLWQKPPGGSWTPFARGTDEEDVHATAHRYRLGPVPAGTAVRYRMIFAGNPDTPIKASVAFSQDGDTLTGGRFEERGRTDEDGVALRSREVELDDDE